MYNFRWDFFCPPPEAPAGADFPFGPGEDEESSGTQDDIPVVKDERALRLESRIHELEQMVVSAQKAAREEAWKRHLADRRVRVMSNGSDGNGSSSHESDDGGEEDLRAQYLAFCASFDERSRKNTLRGAAVKQCAKKETWKEAAYGYGDPTPYAVKHVALVSRQREDPPHYSPGRETRKGTRLND